MSMATTKDRKTAATFPVCNSAFHWTTALALSNQNSRHTVTSWICLDSNHHRLADRVLWVLSVDCDKKLAVLSQVRDVSADWF